MGEGVNTGPLPLDPAHLADPFPAYARLRQAGPVHRVTLPGGALVWLVTRYADVRAALADPRLSLDKRHAAGGWKGFTLPPALDANLLNMDPPDHTRLRRLAAKVFTPGRVEGLRERVQAVTDELLDAVAPRGRADLIAWFAAPLPVTVISGLLGVPARYRADFRDWAGTMLTAEAGDPAGVKEAVGNIHRFLAELISGKRAAPADDLLSALIAARDDEDRLSEEELTSLAFLILLAGFENSVNLIGNGVLTLLRHPARLAELRADPDLLPSAVEELLRYDGLPGMAIRRFPVEDVEIGGVTIPAGETVLLSLTSANRDPRRFDGPDELDFHRGDNPHLGFGHGIHYCLGAPLARMEGQIAIGTLIRRFPDLALALPVQALRWRPSFRTRSLLELPVTFSRRT